MRRIITYGTFDLFHNGHYNILKRAKAAGDYLVVGVTSESYDIERGKLNVRDDLMTRIRNVENTGFADKVIIEEYQGQKINDISKYNIDCLIVGSDWQGKFDYLKNYCEVLYLERTKSISSTQLREDSGLIFKVGIVTDTVDDHGFSEEALFVSGVHTEGVFSSIPNIAETCCALYQLDFWADDYQKFLSQVDCVYIACDLEHRATWAEAAVDAGKWVICDTPISLDASAVSRIYGKAGTNNVCVMERVPLAYLRAFTQLVWLLHGGLIGDIQTLQCTLNLNHCGFDMLEAKSNVLFAITKLMGMEPGMAERGISFSQKNGSSYFIGVLPLSDVVATFQIVSVTNIDSRLDLFGTKGHICIPDQWWNIGYFEVHSHDQNKPIQRYSFNFEGNGFRYLLQELMIMVKDGRTASTRFTDIDSLAIVDILNQFHKEKS